MKKIKKGDIVGRISYGGDILFVVDKIIKASNKKSFAILKGLTIRIQADAPIEDLELIEKRQIDENTRSIENKVNRIIKNNKMIDKRVLYKNRSRGIVYTGKILHLDGDRNYTEKSARYYREMGLNAVVKNISENKQKYCIKQLLERYKPDILVITGHDGMIKNNTGYNDIYNYRNSNHFIETVTQARNWEKERGSLVIFAGACQSFFEAIMTSGADFASSPARVLIDFVDPLIVAGKLAIADRHKYVTIHEIAPDLKEGTRGVGGIGAYGRKKTL